jgi:hypothetical protein
MRICMAPSSPHAMRTYHLLRIPDILLANDSRLLGSNRLSNTAGSKSIIVPRNWSQNVEGPVFNS